MDTTGAMALPKAAKSVDARTHEVSEFRVPSRPRMISAIRRRIRKFAQKMAFTPDQLDDIGVAVGEAATNAVKYGRNPFGSNTVSVKLEKSDDALRVFISDTGPGFDPSTVCPPCEGDLCECGRGIMCMRLLMDEVVFHRLDRGMCVEMAKRTRM